jgi:hypothetical protein
MKKWAKTLSTNFNHFPLNISDNTKPKRIIKLILEIRNWTNIKKTRKNCFRYLKLMSSLNVAICTTISYTLWVEWYYLKNNYLTLRSKVKVPQGHYGTRHTTLWSCTHIPNIIDLSGKTKKLWSRQASLRRSRSGRKNQTKTMSPFVWRGDIIIHKSEAQMKREIYLDLITLLVKIQP